MKPWRLLTAFLLVSTIPSAADLKIVTHSTLSGGGAARVETRYVQGKRQRVEIARDGATGPHRDVSTQIYQCDVLKTFELNLKDRLYNAVELRPNGLPREFVPSSDVRLRANGPMWEYTITTEDTGRRAKVFGFDAWHVRVTTITKSHVSPVGSSKLVVDHWYVDLDVRAGCQSRLAFDQANTDFLEGELGYKVTRVGKARIGFPVLSRSVNTIRRKIVEHVVEVKEISTAPLDPQLFEVPKDFQPALKSGGRVYMHIPDSPKNRLKAGWQGFWEGVAKFVF